MAATTLPAEIVSTIEDVGFLESIPPRAVTLLGSMFIWVLSLVMILTAYSRFFKPYNCIGPHGQLYGAALQADGGIAFLKSYAAICLEGCVIVLACVIFSVFVSTPPALGNNGMTVATARESHESILKIDRKFSGSRRAYIHQRRSMVSRQGGTLKLRVILNRFSVEVFVNDGEQVMTATVMTDVTAKGISFLADGSVDMNVVKYDLFAEEP